MGTMIEIDLQDGDGMIVSVAQADSDVWAGLAAQAQQLVANKPGGFGLIVNDRVFNPPERTLDSIGAVQNWLAAQSNVGGARKVVAAAAPVPLTTSGPGLVAAIAGAAIGGAVAGVLGAIVGGIGGWWLGNRIVPPPPPAA